MGEPVDRPPLPWDLASAIARAGVDPSLPRAPLRTALREAIGERGGYFAMDEDERGWVVCLQRPEEQECRSVEPEQALAWCLVWLMLDEQREVDLEGTPEPFDHLGLWGIDQSNWSR